MKKKKYRKAKCLVLPPTGNGQERAQNRPLDLLHPSLHSACDAPIALDSTP